jgi:hypothetical protein
VQEKTFDVITPVTSPAARVCFVIIPQGPPVFVDTGDTRAAFKEAQGVRVSLSGEKRKGVDTDPYAIVMRCR